MHSRSPTIRTITALTQTPPPASLPSRPPTTSSVTVSNALAMIGIMASWPIPRQAYTVLPAQASILWAATAALAPTVEAPTSGRGQKVGSARDEVLSAVPRQVSTHRADTAPKHDLQKPPLQLQLRPELLALELQVKIA